MNHKIYLFVFLALTGIGIYSCQDEFESEEVAPVQPVEPERTTRLGKKLENPYSVANMQRALDTMLQAVRQSTDPQARALRQASEQIKIKATDWYVRFLPHDSLELERLQEDTTLVLYDHPLDYEIEEQGAYYHDPGLAEDRITWQYTVVKPDYVFPDIEYELLSELFIPESSEGYYEAALPQGRSMAATTHSFDKLETVALYLTDNLPEEEKAQIEKEKKAAARARRVCIWFICWNEPDRWRPSGTVKVQDTELGWQPIEGVKVRARRWFTTKTDRTDRYGYFRTGSFKRPANYSLVWETYQFSIRQKFLVDIFARQAWMDGPKQRKPWNVKLYPHSEHWFHGTIFQAAYHYYYQHIKGLRRPPQNSSSKPQMKIRAHFKANDDRNGRHCKGCRLFGVFARLRIYNPKHSSSAIYATTIHELAHASHWQLRKNQWNGKTSAEVKESWARGVQWELTRIHYHDYFPDYSRLRYTGIVEDMIDGSKNRISDYYWTEPNPWVTSRRSYNDSVSGYTITQIEYVLSSTSSWESWKNNLKNRYNNGTENHLDAAFNFWNTK